MVYVVHDVYDDTEEREKYRVAYQSVNGGELYVRPLDMFTTDRFLVLGQMRDFIASNR